MKYHISFDDRHTLSFKILNTLSAKAWTDVILSVQPAEQSIFRAVLPSYYPAKNYLNGIRYHYEKALEVGLDPEFKLKFDMSSYDHEDFITLDKKIDFLYYKVVVHEYYYNDEKEDEFKIHAKGLKFFKEKFFDAKFNPQENYLWIKTDSQETKKILVDEQMRNEFTETERPKLVIRACPDVDLKSLDILEKRNDPTGYSKKSVSYMKYITCDYKICYYQDSLDKNQATDLIKFRRWNIVDFVAKNKIDVNPSLLHHYNFVSPIVAHCINEDTLEEHKLFEVFDTAENIKIRIEE